MPVALASRNSRDATRPQVSDSSGARSSAARTPVSSAGSAKVGDRARVRAAALAGVQGWSGRVPACAQGQHGSAGLGTRPRVCRSGHGTTRHRSRKPGASLVTGGSGSSCPPPCLPTVCAQLMETARKPAARPAVLTGSKRGTSNPCTRLTNRTPRLGGRERPDRHPSGCRHDRVVHHDGAPDRHLIPGGGGQAHFRRVLAGVRVKMTAVENRRSRQYPVFMACCTSLSDGLAEALAHFSVVQNICEPVVYLQTTPSQPFVAPR